MQKRGKSNAKVVAHRLWFGNEIPLGVNSAAQSRSKRRRRLVMTEGARAFRTTPMVVGQSS